jgi:hypothetical protein
MAKEKLNKVIKGLRKASKTHAQQAKTLSTIKMKAGGSVPDNVANPSLYKKAKAKAKAKFDVFPSAYASGYMVQEYKRMGGKYKGATGGEVTLKPIPKDNKGLGKLPTKVRNRMGYMKDGGTVNKNTTMVQGRGCGAIDPSKQKKTRVPRT